MRPLDGGRIGIAAQALGIAGGRLRGGAGVRAASARASACPSASTRWSSGCSPTWRPRSRRRGCSPCARPGSRTQGGRSRRGGGHGQAVRRGDGDARDHRRRPGARGLRLHQGVPGRAPLPRRQDHPDLRGHVADPEAGHRPPRSGAGRAAAEGRRARRRRQGRLTWRRAESAGSRRCYGPSVARVARARRACSSRCPAFPVQPALHAGGPRAAGATRTSSATRASSPSPGGRTRRCTGAGCGPCACSPGFGRPEDTNAPLQVPARAGADRALHRLRHAGPDGLRRRPPARPRRGRPRGGVGLHAGRLRGRCSATSRWTRSPPR